MATKKSERRLAENEVIFRQANQKVQEDLQDLYNKNEAEGFGDLNGNYEETKLYFYCECADEKCRQRIVLTMSQYKKLHTSKSTFVVLPGHAVPEVERVLKKERDYFVVDKIITPPEKADRLNPTNLENTKK